MNIILNQKSIQELCGVISYKRGESFWRNGKVSVTLLDSNVCEATVLGTEEFSVKVTAFGEGSFQTKCSCPSLASFDRKCQHVAAVLLTICDYQRKETRTFIQNSNATHTSAPEQLFSLFSDRPKPRTGRQAYFENRDIIPISFTCHLTTTNQIAISFHINKFKVLEVNHFLKHLVDGKPIPLEANFTFNPSIHCFDNDSDILLKKLAILLKDKTLPNENQPHSDIIIIPPTVWEHLAPFLFKAPLTFLEFHERNYQLKISSELPPIQFAIDTLESGYLLTVSGLKDSLVLESYRVVLVKGMFYQLSEENSERLLQLQQMLTTANNHELIISKQQMDIFLETVLPGLKKLGQVTVSDRATAQLNTVPLKAKLFLDRLNNRLLAGLEFHYDNMVINPLEDKQQSLVNRDRTKEAEILQHMEDSLFTRTEEGFFLHNEELEYQFLYHTIPKLQKLLQIYATTAVRNRIFSKPPTPQIRVKVKKERTNWLEFKFEMDGIADQQIRDILQALEEKRKYYRLRNGSLLSLETREFEEIQRFLHALPVQPEDLEAGLNVPIVRGLRLLDSVDTEETFNFEDSFRDFLQDFYHPERLEFEIPNQLISVLRDYQIHGYKWLKTLAKYGFGGILADDMGLGKTLQSIAYIVSELQDIRTKKLPVLIVCPASLTYNWLHEFLKFTPEIQAIVVDGTKEERMKLQQEIHEMDVIITSYPLLRRDIKGYEKQSFHSIFFDEAQNFKNPITQTARAVKRLKAHNRFALTGTPVENSLEELWSIFHVVFPELFLGLQEFSHLSRKQVTRRIKPFLLRRLKEDVLSELPGKIEILDSTELLPEQKKIYAAYLAKLRQETLKHLNKDTLRKNRIKILAGLTRLRQICCHPGLFVENYRGSSAKLEKLLEIIQEAKSSGRRVLIFSQFTKMLAIIGRELSEQGLPFFYLDGQTPPETRVSICNQFNAGNRDFFLISLKAGGTGLNLTGADTVVLYDLWWNPAVEEQAADRAHRMGQKNVVQVIKLISLGTIEEKMNELQERKKLLIEEVLSNSEHMLTEEDIREILMI